MQISIVIINYNSQRFLKKNLSSLVKQSIPFKEIIVIDNNSTDNSKAIVQGFRNCQWIPLSNNSGYSKSANIGISRTTSDLLIIGNPDIFLQQNFNKEIITAFENDSDLQMASPLILRFDKKTIDSAGQKCSLALFPKETGYNKPLSSFKIENREIFSVCGAITIYRRTALKKLKILNEYYDEDFFLFWEDFDIGWRADLYHMKKKLLASAIAYHYRSGSLKRSFLSKIALSLDRPSPIKFQLVKNRYLTLIKNFRFKYNWYSIPFILFKDLVWTLTLTLFAPKIIIKLIKNRKDFLNALKKRRIIKENG